MQRGWVGAEDVRALPFFEGTKSRRSLRTSPGGTVANLESVRPALADTEHFPEHKLLMAADAQTSGGLLLAVPPGSAVSFGRVSTGGASASGG